MNRTDGGEERANEAGKRGLRCRLATIYKTRETRIGSYCLDVTRCPKTHNAHVEEGGNRTTRVMETQAALGRYLAGRRRMRTEMD